MPSDKPLDERRSYRREAAKQRRIAARDKLSKRQQANLDKPRYSDIDRWKRKTSLFEKLRAAVL